MKKFITLLTAIVMVISVVCVPVAAVNITLVDLTSLPVISTKLSAEPGTYDNFDESKVVAYLDGNKLVNGVIEKQNESIEWILMIDTSKSVSEEYFKAEINAVISVLEGLRDSDTLRLYTFEESTRMILNGKETKEDAQSRIKQIVCEGQDTRFYYAIDKLVSFAEGSKSSVCVPVIFSDGVETIKPEDRSKTIESLKYANAPVYGYYPDLLEKMDGGKEKIASFKEIIKATGGETKSFNIKNASKTLASFNSNDTWSLTFTSTKEIPKGDHTLSIDMGDGNKIEKVVQFDEAWEGDKEAPSVKSIITDLEENTVTVEFSEVVKNWDDKSLYSFSVADEDEEPPKIVDIGRISDQTVLLTMDTLDKSGIEIKVSGYMDAADNKGAEATKTLSINQNVVKILTTAGIGVALLAVAAFVIVSVLTKKKKQKAALESGQIQAAYKNGKRIEPKQKQKGSKNKKPVMKFEIPDDDDDDYRKPGKTKAPREEKIKETPEEREARIAAEKEQKKKEEKIKQEAAKFQFYFEEKFHMDDD